MKLLFQFCNLSMLIFFCISCGKVDDVIIMRHSGSFDLPLPSDMRVNSFCVRSFKGKTGNDYLYYLNGIDNSICVYDLSRKNISKRIRIAEKGPEGTGRVVGFSVLGADSILLSSGGYAFNFLIDESGKIVDKFTYDWEPDQPPTFMQWDSWYYRDANLDGNFLYLPQEINFNIINTEFFEQYPVAVYDINLRTSRLLDFNYPASYFKENLPRPLIFSADDDFVYVSMIGNHKVYRIHKKSEQVEDFYLRSSFIDNEIENRNKVSGMEDVLKYNAVNPRYMGIYDDPYRNFTYRLVILPPEDLGNAEGKYVQLDRFPERFSIMVIDKNMKVITEHLFPSNTYHPAGIFVTSEGLCVPRTHPEYYVENGTETAMTIDVFTLGGD